MPEKAIINTVRNYLRTLGTKGFSDSYGVLFGSHVTGKTHQWSDIDFVVISSKLDDLQDRENVYKLWRIAAEVDSRIEPVPCGAKQWLEDDCNAIIDIARREGVVVKL